MNYDLVEAGEFQTVARRGQRHNDEDRDRMRRLAIEAEQDSDPEAHPKPVRKARKSAASARLATKNSFEALPVDTVEDTSDQDDDDFTTSGSGTSSSGSDSDSDSSIEEITNAEVCDM